MNSSIKKKNYIDLLIVYKWNLCKVHKEFYDMIYKYF